MTHTAGPWKAILDESWDDSPGNTHNRFKVFGPKNEYVALITGAKGSIEANVHLISAAPELLEALKACLKVIELHYGHANPKDEDSPVINNARAAIAKAEGGL